MSQKTEHRVHPRQKVALPLLVRDSTSQISATIEFDTHDISLGGAFIRSDILFEIGETLELRFQLAGKVLTLRGKVARVVREPDEGTAGMGIQFIDVSEQDHKRLSDALKAK